MDGQPQFAAGQSARETQEFKLLMDRVLKGSEDAARELVARYERELLVVIRRGLIPRLRSKFDSQDFVQAVWVTFFEHRERLAEFPSSQDLIQFLATIARNKVIDESRRRLQSHGRNVNREISLGAPHVFPKLTATTPTPSAVAIADEQWKQLVDGEPDHYRRVVELRQIGASHAEIADALGLSAKTVQRVLQRLRDKLVP